MPFYHKLGTIPKTRHIQFRKQNGGLYAEHLMGNMGFTGIQSLLYHCDPPTVLSSVEVKSELDWKTDNKTPLQPRHFKTSRLKHGGSPTLDRVPLLYNSDLAISLVHPTENDDHYYRNAQGDELIYVAKGSGVLQTMMGLVPYRQGDYLVIPRGVIYKFDMDEGETRLLVFESNGYIRTPRRYRNDHGQLLEHSPFCERDMRPPEELPVHEDVGAFHVLTKRDNKIYDMVYKYHPFNIVGWDGFYFPWAFNIEDFMPIVGKIHQPPPVHQTFECEGFVVCSFTPRLFDFHPEAVAVPYNHSNVMSDEMIYYASEEFMSRKGIEFGSVTLHPDGTPHGPHPGTVEKSLGAKETDEYAVMADTFKPLKVAAEACEFEVEDYVNSWEEADQ
jgi:homogentisate 1,2-dioxygenase